MNETILKVILVGDSGAGKTSFFIRYFDDKFSINHFVTIGIDFRIQKIEKHGKKFKLQLWDTAGGERFRTFIARNVYRKSNGIFLFFDMSEGDSFNSIEKWMKEIKLHASKDVFIILIGSKNDLEVKVPMEIVEKYAEENNIPFIATSSKTGIGVNEVINRMIDEVSQVDFSGKLQKKEILKAKNENLKTLQNSCF